MHSGSCRYRSAAAIAARHAGAPRSVPEDVPAAAKNRVDCAARYRPAAIVPASAPVFALARHALFRVRSTAAAPAAKRRYQCPADCLFPAANVSGAIPVAECCAADWHVAYPPIAIAVAVAAVLVVARCSVPVQCALLPRLVANRSEEHTS